MPPKKSVEEQYKKHTHKGHILALPDTYVGSTDQTTEEMWILEDKKMVKKNITYIPALYKLFDEGLVNAIDQFVRMKIMAKDNPELNVRTVKNIKISISDKVVSIWNDGDGIDVELHTEQKMYVPELIFGHLLTSSNYADSDGNGKIKHVGGKNGYGAKLINIFSKEFSLTTIDANRKKKFKQIWKNNMDTSEDAIITKCQDQPFTDIEYEADFKRFGIEKYSEDMILLMKKRVYDCAAITDNSVSVFINEEKIEHKNFEKYIDLYLGSKNDNPRAYESVNDRWEIGAALSFDEKFEQISFVNGISTIKGGKHVDYVANAIVKKLAEYILKKKKTNIKTSYIKENLVIFVNSTIDNPSFDSQTKETLTTIASKFGSKCEFSDKFIDKLAKCGIVEKAMSLNAWKDNVNLKKTDGKKRHNLRGIPKLDDANWAGGSKSKECTLILTEGDSAKSMAVSGLAVVGRDKFGVFPLRGKVLNVRDANAKKILENEEINNIKKIMGLQAGKEHKIEELRYGNIMIMTDQDVDGSHIKGLLFNVFDTLWPDLTQQEGFLNSMLTPIIKASKKKIVKEFYSLTEYDKWKQKNNDGKGWDIKYYKGLGTSTSKEAKEYFKSLKTVTYSFTENCKNALDKAFNKDRADDRKEWLKNHDRDAVIDPNQKVASYEEFVDKELRHFSNYDTERSIPNIMDGQKTSQRKILFSAFKRNLTKEIKVAQFAGYVSEHSAYHHGEMSLNGAIVNMAQNFVGSNNINLLKPNGMFGTRLQGGKDSASTRYIYTELSKITHTLFNKNDEPVLKFLDDDGLLVEPDWYCPILPMILINGCKGIGTGFSTDIPCFNPMDILNNIKLKMEGKDYCEITPWYMGFTGSIHKSDKNKYITTGKYTIVNINTVTIDELPVSKWTDDYYEYLESLAQEVPAKGKGKPIPQYLRSIEKHSTESKVKFILHFMPSMLSKLQLLDSNSVSKLENLLKLTTTKSLSNIHLFNSKCVIQKYNTVNEILDEYYVVRLNLYQKRKDALLKSLNNDLIILDARVKFIINVIDNTIIVNNTKKIDLENKLSELKFPKLNKDMNVSENGSYQYLISMPIYNLTLEKKEELIEEQQKKLLIIQELESKSTIDLWREELDNFENEYNKFLKITADSFEDNSICSAKKTKVKKNKIKEVGKPIKLTKNK
jgi:DNA topoisomerase-2